MTFDSMFDWETTVPKRHCSIPLHPRFFVGIQKKRHTVTTVRQFIPHLPSGPLKELLGLLSKNPSDRLGEILREHAETLSRQKRDWSLDETATYLVLSDLATLGWSFRVVGNTVYILPKTQNGKNSVEVNALEKALVRKALCEKKAHQLAENGTKTFITSMQKTKTFNGEDISIDVLVDDGKTLAETLRKFRGKNLKKVIDPYIQFVDEETCKYTGYKLQDIWRYFRHTWSIEYRPTPGRSLSFLVRNKARKYHPIIGIVGLANVVFQLRDRDDYIGWTPDGIIRRVDKDSSFWPEFKQAAIQCLLQAKEVIRSDDLMRDIGKVSSRSEVVKRLYNLAGLEVNRRKTQLNQAFADAKAQSSIIVRSRNAVKKDGSIDWQAQSETPLFRRKRAETLADILFALDILEQSSDVGSEVIAMLPKEIIKERYDQSKYSDAFEKAFRIAIREIKKIGAATRMMDVNVCGASPVYREILGGKLTALSLFCEEVQKAYSNKYSNAASEIASSMAGRPIIKPTRMSLLTTTSLYGVGSSQYNRVQMKYGDRIVKWEKIGTTEGYGTIHLSKRTIEKLRELSINKSKRRNVNNQFGEGASPLLRQMREGLSFLGFEPNEVLQHSQCRIVYLLELYPGAAKDLLFNKDRHPKAPGMAQVAKMWIERWLSMRIQNDEILARLATYSPETVRQELLPANGSD